MNTQDQDQYFMLLTTESTESTELTEVLNSRSKAIQHIGG
jgi:hypothetical protein